MPHDPYYKGGGGHKYEIKSVFEHLVADYAGLNLYEIQHLPYEEYLALRRDAFIEKLSRTEAGQEYLNEAWRLEQTEPDRAALRAKYGKKTKGAAE